LLSFAVRLRDRIQEHLLSSKVSGDTRREWDIGLINRVPTTFATSRPYDACLLVSHSAPVCLSIVANRCIAHTRTDISYPQEGCPSRYRVLLKMADNTGRHSVARPIDRTSAPLMSLGAAGTAFVVDKIFSCRGPISGTAFRFLLHSRHIVFQSHGFINRISVHPLWNGYPIDIGFLSFSSDLIRMQMQLIRTPISMTLLVMALWANPIEQPTLAILYT